MTGLWIYRITNFTILPDQEIQGHPNKVSRKEARTILREADIAENKNVLFSFWWVNLFNQLISLKYSYKLNI